MKSKEDILYDLGLGLDPKTDGFILQAMQEYADQESNRLDLLVIRQNTDIYSMKLHQTIDLQNKENWDKYGYLPYRYITRVPGGWIYSNYDTDKDAYITGDKIFVPFDNDLQR